MVSVFIISVLLLAAAVAPVVAADTTHDDSAVALTGRPLPLDQSHLR